MSKDIQINGYLRNDGRKGIRNIIAVTYLVECAHHVAHEIADPFRDKNVHLIGFGGCNPNEYAYKMMTQLCLHPNVGTVLIVALGCESFDHVNLENAIRKSQRPVSTLIIQERRGTLPSIQEGREWIEDAIKEITDTSRVNQKSAKRLDSAIFKGMEII